MVGDVKTNSRLFNTTQCIHKAEAKFELETS